MTDTKIFTHTPPPFHSGAGCSLGRTQDRKCVTASTLIALKDFFCLTMGQKLSCCQNNKATESTTTPTTTTTLKTVTTPPKMSSSLKPYIQTLIDGNRDLTSTETEEAFNIILSGADPIQVSALLTLLRAKNETPAEIAGMVRAMNSACNAVHIPDTKLLDIVGTGGDGADTINISTASVVLAAACGCTVAKAGNRSVSSACGSADVLESLGVKVDLVPEQVVQCVEQCGVAFMFAPVNHPAMRHVAPVRKALGVRTCFNVIGPMINAAGAQRAVIGVFHEELVELMAGALKEVGRVDHAVVIHGVGLDEISPMGPATILEVSEHWDTYFLPLGEERSAKLQVVCDSSKCYNPLD